MAKQKHEGPPTLESHRPELLKGPKASEVDEQLPEGYKASRDQVGAPQPLQALSDTAGRGYPPVISTGRTHSDERVADAILLANPPTGVTPAQNPFPLKEGDPLPVNPATGELSFQGGPSKLDSPVLPVHEGGTAGGVQAGAEPSELAEVQPELEPGVKTTTEKARGSSPRK